MGRWEVAGGRVRVGWWEVAGGRVRVGRWEVAGVRVGRWEGEGGRVRLVGGVLLFCCSICSCLIRPRRSKTGGRG